MINLFIIFFQKLHANFTFIGQIKCNVDGDIKMLYSFGHYCFHGILFLLKILLQNKLHLLLQVRTRIDSRKKLLQTQFMFIFSLTAISCQPKI